MFTVNGKQFVIKDCGGRGDCLFKCLAFKLPDCNHEDVRSDVVNFVTDNWNVNGEYRHLVDRVLDIKNRRVYSQYMNSKGTFASEVECIAAAYLYNVNITIIKKLSNGIQFSVPLRTDSIGQTIYLLFSGDTDNGHFQILDQQVNTASATSLSVGHEEVDCATVSDETENRISSNCDSDIFVTSENSVSADCDLSSSVNSSDFSTCSEDFSEYLKVKLLVKSSRNSSSPSSTDSEVKSPFSKNEKAFIVNARHYFQDEKDAGVCADLNQVVQRTAQCLNISERSVVRVTAEVKEHYGELIEPRNYAAGRKCIEFDEHLEGIVRRSIFDMYMRKEYPTVEKIMQHLRETVSNFPQVSDFTMRKLFKRMNFRYKKMQNRSVLMESSSVAGKRAAYLQKIHFYRRNGWHIYFVDETWCGANHHRQHGWLEKIEDSFRDNFDVYRSGVQAVGGYRGGFLVPSGAGKRVIILHIGSKNGFLDGSLKCFIGKKGSADYHDEMNAAHFEEWFREVLHKLPSKSVIVIDQAPYHTMIDPERRNPTSSWRKADIIQWMVKRNISLPMDTESFEHLTKPYLLQLCLPYKFEKSYLLEKITEDIRGSDVKLLWLPVAHCEFNAIEYVWAYVKKKVAELNTTFKIHDVWKLCESVMNTVPPTLWEKCVKHVEKIEEEYRCTDERMDIIMEMEPLIINVGEDDSSDEERSEELRDSD